LILMLTLMLMLLLLLMFKKVCASQAGLRQLWKACVP